MIDATNPTTIPHSVALLLLVAERVWKFTRNRNGNSLESKVKVIVNDAVAPINSRLTLIETRMDTQNAIDAAFVARAGRS